MEWFNELHTGWKMLAVNGGLMLMPFLLPNRIVVSAGRGIGVVLSRVLGQKLGKKEGEKVEGYVQGTIQAFVVEGIIEGMNADDGEV